MVRQRRKAAGGGTEKRAAKRSTSMLVLWYEDNKRWMPLIATVFGGASLYLLMQVKTLRSPVAFLGGLGWIIGYLIWGLGRPPEAPARPGRSPVWWPLLALVTIAAAGLGSAYVTTVYRGEPDFRTTLAQEGAKARFRLAQPKQRIVVVVHGSFQREVGANAEGEYSVAVARGGREVTIDGKLERQTSRTRVRRNVRGTQSSEYDYGTHEIPSLGKGEYVIEHLGVGDTLRPGLRIAVYTTWASRLLLGAGGAGLFLLALLFDVIGARAGHRTRAASGVASAASFAETFRTMATPDAIVTAVIVGIIASFIVGGGLGWVADKIAKAAGGETISRRANDDDDDEKDEPESSV